MCRRTEPCPRDRHSTVRRDRPCPVSVRHRPSMPVVNGAVSMAVVACLVIRGPAWSRGQTSLATTPNPRSSGANTVAAHQSIAATSGAVPIDDIRPAHRDDEITTQSEQSDPTPELSSLQQRVVEYALSLGDKTFLMVDKAHGRLILLHEGKPLFRDAALTGASLSDRLPPGELRRRSGTITAPADKVTPAGRFTVRRARDLEFGCVLDVTELQGPDWSIGIHQVYLGTPSERRDVRLASQDNSDKTITWGCINVSRATISTLMRLVPSHHRMPLYVLPRDEILIDELFSTVVP
jgi:L,D-transpeptidase catalytic domain